MEVFIPRWNNVITLNDIPTYAVFAATLLLALATFGIIVDARQSRLEQERQRRELAFRAALNELADNITRLNQRLPEWGLASPWWKPPLEYCKLVELMDAVWIDPMLWERITGGVLLTIRTQEAELCESMQRKDRDTEVANRERDTYYRLDLYLKQLIRYIYCEMKRQKLGVEHGFRDRKVFKPLAHSYVGAELSIKEGVRFYENDQFRHFPDEPNDPAFSGCRLEILIGEAQYADDKQSASLKTAL